MPLLEFECPACSRRFEDLVRSGETPDCPGCGPARGKAGRPRRLLSTFGVGSAPVRSSGACGPCGDPRGPGACARDD